MNEKELKAYIDEQYKGCQPYQTVEYNNKIIHRGTESCWASWANIQKLGIDWRDKKVCDIGSYFGYFSTKVLRAGAKELTALDNRDEILEVCRTVLKANGFNNFNTVQRALGKNEVRIPEGFDVTLVLNCLHHIKKCCEDSFDQLMDNLFNSTKSLVFEINANNVQEVKEAAKRNSAKLVKDIPSHRKNPTGQRRILYFVRD